MTSKCDSLVFSPSFSSSFFIIQTVKMLRDRGEFARLFIISKLKMEVQAKHHRHEPVVLGPLEAETGEPLEPRNSRQHTDLNLKTYINKPVKAVHICNLS